MATHTVWALNLDAEVELSRIGSYATRKSLHSAMQPHFERAAQLLPVNALVLGWGDEAGTTSRSVPLPPQYLGAPGLAWCPTPTAIAALDRAGARPISAPSSAVLAAVNHRAFCAELGQTLPGARFVREPSELESLLREPSITGRWLCKRAFGFAGRGQRRVTGMERADDRRWLSDCIEPGGFQVEPCVEIDGEYSLHGVIHRSGALTLGQICRQFLDPGRLWLGAERLTPGVLSSVEVDALRVEADRVAVALHEAGYFGPFGVDSFIWKAPDGSRRLNPRSEINARLTMAFPIGMGPDWIEQLLAASGRDA